MAAINTLKAIYTSWSGPTRTTNLPKFSPFNKPIKALTVFSSPSTLCSLYFISPAINHLAIWANTISQNDYFTVDSIILPVGISFYTFQTISYCIDIYRKQLKPIDSIIDFGFFVSFFPQLVAGPIVRASEFIPQIKKEICITKHDFGRAVFFILKGLIKKMIFADFIAANFLDRVFDAPEMFSGFKGILVFYQFWPWQGTWKKYFLSKRYISFRKTFLLSAAYRRRYTKNLFSMKSPGVGTSPCPTFLARNPLASVHPRAPPPRARAGKIYFFIFIINSLMSVHRAKELFFLFKSNHFFYRTF